MSQLATRKPPQLLQPFWPLDDPHALSHVRLDGEPPLNAEGAMSLLLRLASQSDAMRSLQTSDGELISERAASALRGEMAEGMRELAELVDPDSAEVIRMRARILAGSADHHEMTLAIAAREGLPALEVVCGPMCTWRMKTREPLHSFVAAARDERRQAILDRIDAVLDAAVGEVGEEIGAEGMRVSFPLPMNVTDLLVSAGEAAGHPKHFAYFMPEDEGIDGLPISEQRTLYMRNVHLIRYREITVPLGEALLEGPIRSANVPVADTLMPWIRGHDHGHNVVVKTTDFGSWQDRLGIEPFAMLSEAFADVYGFLMTVSAPWLAISGVSPLDMSGTHIAEMLHYMRRGPQYFGDPGAAYLELGFLAENGYVEIDADGRVRWSEDGFRRGMVALAATLTEATVGADDERGSERLIARYGWPTETAAKRTLDAMRRELTNVPTSIAFYRTSDVAAASEAVPLAA